MGTGLASVRQGAFPDDAPESRAAHFLKMWVIAVASTGGVYFAALAAFALAAR